MRHAATARPPGSINGSVRVQFTLCAADRLQVDEPVTTVPTIGFNVETLQYKNIKFQVRSTRLAAPVISSSTCTPDAHQTWCPHHDVCLQVWDLGGQSSIRPYWRCYYPNTDAIIFVVDSTDVERLEVAKAELFAMLEVSGKGADRMSSPGRMPLAARPPVANVVLHQ